MTRDLRCTVSEHMCLQRSPKVSVGTIQVCACVSACLCGSVLGELLCHFKAEVWDISVVHENMDVAS